MSFRRLALFSAVCAAAWAGPGAAAPEEAQGVQDQLRQEATTQELGKVSQQFLEKRQLQVREPEDGKEGEMDKDDVEDGGMVKVIRGAFSILGGLAMIGGAATCAITGKAPLKHGCRIATKEEASCNWYLNVIGNGVGGVALIVIFLVQMFM